MAPTTDAPVLFPDYAWAPDGVVILNGRCRLQERGGYRLVTVCGMPLAHFAAGDRVGEAHAMVSLVELGWAQQSEVARAFGCDVRTVRRHQRRFEDGGLAALGRPRGFPRGRPRVAQGRKDAVNQWKAEGVSNREIARRLGIDEKAVRKLAKRLGWVERPAEQMTVPFEDADPKLSASEEQQAGAALLAAGFPHESEVRGGRMRIPRQADHRFRGNPTTDSEASRPPIPRQADQLVGPRRNGGRLGSESAWRLWREGSGAPARNRLSSLHRQQRRGGADGSEESSDAEDPRDPATVVASGSGCARDGARVHDVSQHGSGVSASS